MNLPRKAAGSCPPLGPAIPLTAASLASVMLAALRRVISRNGTFGAATLG
jgi:hypothetical protein